MSTDTATIQTTTTFPFVAEVRLGGRYGPKVELRAKTLRGLEVQLGQRLTSGMAVIFICPTDYRTGYRLANAEATGCGWRYVEVTREGYDRFGIRRYDEKVA